jgi:hypothetical protein
LAIQAFVLSIPEEYADKYGFIAKLFAQDKEVAFAGPLLVLADDICHASGLGHRIFVYPNTQQMKSYGPGEELAEKWGGKYDFQAGYIEFEPTIGWKVIDALNAIAESGLFSQFELERWIAMELD